MTIASNRVFLFVHLRAASGGWQALNERVTAVLADWPAVVRVGSFMGLFGISNQELFVLLSLPAGEDGRTELRARLPADVELVDTLALRATARPSDDAPLTRAGVYGLVSIRRFVGRAWPHDAADLVRQPDVLGAIAHPAS